MLNNLKRKYGNSVEEILAYAERAREELETITHAEERINELEEMESAFLVSLAEKGTALSQRRKESAQEMSTLLEKELGDLRMENARFAVSISLQPDETGLPLTEGERVAFDASGFDQVEFLVETNPGEGFNHW